MVLLYSSCNYMAHYMSHLPLSVSAFVVCQDLFSIHAILRCTTYITIMKCDMHFMFCVQKLIRQRVGHLIVEH